MPEDFNQSTSIESYLKLQWVYSNTSITIIRKMYVSNINIYYFQETCPKKPLSTY